MGAEGPVRLEFFGDEVESSGPSPSDAAEFGDVKEVVVLGNAATPQAAIIDASPNTFRPIVGNPRRAD